jgi:hypothetical protein
MTHFHSFVYHRCLHNLSNRQRRYITLSVNKIYSNVFDYNRHIILSVDLRVCHSVTCISFNVHGSVHRKNILIYHVYITRYNVTQSILSVDCSTCFGWYHRPSSGAHTTLSTASGICHTITATCRYSVPDDRWWYQPKHVKQFPDKINCVSLHLVGYILEYILRSWLRYSWQIILIYLRNN